MNGRNSMSLDGGYSGSLDHAIANLHVGRTQGRRQGIEEGLAEGYQQGVQDGYQNGWEAAVAAGNEQIHKQMQYTREHIEEKNRIQAEVTRQLELIDRLEAKVAALESENAALRGENSKLRKNDAGLSELIDGLKAANQRLQTQLTEFDDKLQERTRQYSDQLWQYNRTLIFMNAVRGVLDELASDNSSNAHHVRRLFAEKYGHHVNQGLKDGVIKVAPELDDAFATALPKTKKFIADMLSSVGPVQEPELHASDPDDDDLAL